MSRRRRRQFALLLGLALTASVAEAVSLGAVLPFLGILTQPERVFGHPAIAEAARLLGYASAAQMVLPLTIAFASAAIAAGGLRLILLSAVLWLGNVIGTDLGIEVFRRTLYQPYQVHVSRNSSEVISGVTEKINTVINVLIALMSAAVMIVLFAVILVTVLFINSIVAGAAMVGMGICYGVIIWLTHQRLAHYSRVTAHGSTEVIRAAQEGLGAIRDVLVDGTQNVYCDAYRKAVERAYRAVRGIAIISQGPRYVMESLLLVLIAVFAFMSSRQPGGIGEVLPLLAVLALGAQRMLPLLQQTYTQWTVVSGGYASLAEVINLLDQPLPPDANLPPPSPLLFCESIQFEDVSFRYGETSPWVLDRVSFSIPKGARIGIVGRTGSGKSTILDLLMALLVPSQGRVLVDGLVVSNEANRRSWQRTIAHVPQNIYLADTTIAENIALGVPLDRIDYERVRWAARLAQMADFVENSPEGYYARVGERGCRLSGGQRQRIGIARALYKQARVLIFDEATNALDKATERAVMGAIEALDCDITLLIVAHNLSTLERTDAILYLENGRVVGYGRYDELIKTNQAFSDMALSIPKGPRGEADPSLANEDTAQ